MELAARRDLAFPQRTNGGVIPAIARITYREASASQTALSTGIMPNKKKDCALTQQRTIQEFFGWNMRTAIGSRPARP